MAIMIAGLVLFLGIHLLPIFTGTRSRMAQRLGDTAYRGAFSLISALGLVLIVAGYWMRPERVQVFEPLPAARAAAPWLVTLAFVLFASANMPAHIRRAVRHPMLLGLMLWSGVHLLANGDLAGTVLFGSFFAYSIIDVLSAIQRRAVKVFVPQWRFDVIAIVAGVVLAYLTIRFHPAVFGTGPVA